jgi:hypothetical protein
MAMAARTPGSSRVLIDMPSEVPITLSRSRRKKKMKNGEERQERKCECELT